MSSDSDEGKKRIINSAVDIQRLKLEKLMKNPDKPILIPERPKDKKVPTVPEFVRNVMGSSAGAGSGEFHVYRHLRRKEYARQKFIQEQGDRARKDDDYHRKLELNKLAAEERTAKKRAKRLKKKQKLKALKKLKVKSNKSEEDSKKDSNSDHESSSENEDNDERSGTEEDAPNKTS